MSKARPTAAKKRPMFLVARLALDAGHVAVMGYYPISGKYDAAFRLVPVRAFAKKSDAEIYARELDDELRATFPPPLFVSMPILEESLASRLPSLLKELGLPPIPFGKRPYGLEFSEWWAANAKDMSAEQRGALWEPFAGMNFHLVEEIEMEG